MAKRKYYVDGQEVDYDPSQSFDATPQPSTTTEQPFVTPKIEATTPKEETPVNIKYPKKLGEDYTVTDGTGNVKQFSQAEWEKLRKTGNTPTQAMGAVQQVQQDEQRINLANQAGVINPQDVNTPPLIDSATGGLVTTGYAIGGGVGGAIGGATTGAAIGAAGGPIGAAGGAVIGGIFGFGGALLAKLGFEDKGNVKDIKTEFDASKKNLNALISYVNAGGNQQVALEKFNQELGDIYASQIKLKKIASNDLRRWLSGVKDEQIEVQNFVDTEADKYIQRMQLAIMKPNPNQVYTQEIQ